MTSNSTRVVVPAPEQTLGPSTVYTTHFRVLSSGSRELSDIGQFFPTIFSSVACNVLTF